MILLNKWKIIQLDETIFPKELKIHPIGGNYFPKEVGKIIQLEETIFLKKWEKSSNAKNHPIGWNYIPKEVEKSSNAKNHPIGWNYLPVERCSYKLR